MSFSLKSIKSKDDIRFSDHCDALVKWLKKYWNIKVEPKGDYKKLRENYRDYEGMDELDEKEILKEYPLLKTEDIKAALLYASKCLDREVTVTL